MSFTQFLNLFLDADVCDPSPCHNNATCNDHFDFFNFFNCTCLAGYTGELCETGKSSKRFWLVIRNVAPVVLSC